MQMNLNSNQEIKAYFDTFESQVKKSHLEKAHSLIDIVNNKFTQDIETDKIQINAISEYLDIHQPVTNETPKASRIKRHQTINPEQKVDSRDISKDNKEFIEIVKQKKEMDKRILLRLKEEEEKIQKEYEEEQNKLRDELEEQKRIRALKAEQKLKEMKERQIQRDDQIKQANEILKEQLRIKPLYLIKQEEDQKEVEDILQARKKKLEQIRDLYKPITKQDLIEHQTKIAQLTSQIQLHKHQDQMKSLTHDKINSHYQYTEGYARAQKERQQRFQEEEEQKQKIRNLREKQLAYAKDVPIPNISQEKKFEIQHQQEKIHHHVDFKSYLKSNKNRNNKFNQQDTSKDVSDIEKRLSSVQDLNPKEVGKNYLKYAKQKRKIFYLNADSNVSYDDSQMSLNHNSQISGIRSQKIERKPDYLQEIKALKRIPKRDLIHDWEKIINNQKYQSSVRNEIILSEAQKLEEQAQRQEILQKFGAKNIDNNTDELLIGAIKAKLALLG